jgi:hypothetical protein
VRRHMICCCPWMGRKGHCPSRSCDGCSCCTPLPQGGACGCQAAASSERSRCCCHGWCCCWCCHPCLTKQVSKRATGSFWQHVHACSNDKLPGTALIIAVGQEGGAAVPLLSKLQ